MPEKDPRQVRTDYLAFLLGQIKHIPVEAQSERIAQSVGIAQSAGIEGPRLDDRALVGAGVAPRSAVPKGHEDEWQMRVESKEIPFALPDYEAPPAVELSAGFDADGTEYVFEDEPEADPLVDPRYDAQDRNWVRYRSHWGGFLRLLGVAVIIFFLLTTIRGRVYDWIDGQIVPSGPIGEPVIFTIRNGEAVNQIATNLDNAGVIGNATTFRYWLRCDGPNGGEITISGFLRCDIDSSFEIGAYALIENMPYADVNNILISGPIPEVYENFTIPEGLRVVEIIDRMIEANPQFDREQIVAALNNPAYVSNYLPEDIGQYSWFEGLLFPATYDVAEDDLRDEARFIQRMSNTFDQRFSALLDEVGRDPVIEQLGLTDYQIITIASLIEEEARVDVDRPQMARVMYNRLLRGEPLGVDASVYFALNKSFTEGLTALDLLVDSPYNTRLNTGIPPTPIAAPGEAALRAALQPDPNPELLFWARTDHGGVDGAHTFTTNINDHNAAVAVCRQLGYCG